MMDVAQYTPASNMNGLLDGLKYNMVPSLVVDVTGTHF